MNFKTTLLLLCLIVSFMSCNNDELFIEPVIEEVLEKETDTNTEDELTDNTTIESTLPCDFNLNSVAPNSIVIINCVLDLSGQTINLPDNVTLQGEGGDIINGTINFGENNTLAGELLNPSLTISGAKPQLKDPTFTFDPNRWGIVEGVVSDEVAFNNRNILQNTIDLAKSFGISVFEIGAMDAFFHLEYVWTNAKGYNDRAIHLPSDFHLKMNNETFLRLQPNFWPRGRFLGVYNESNVQITGGNLIGDRYEHDYSPINDEVGLPRNSHEWPGIIIISGSENVVLDGVYMAESTGDALILGASGHRTNPNTKFNKNVIARNCTMHESRRNNISITDGEDLIIEGCIISDAGLGDNIFEGNTKIISSAGIAPKVGIDIEPFRGFATNGDFINYEKVERVLITGCTFTGNNVSSFINYSGSDVVFENNFSDQAVSASFDKGGTKFINNTLKANANNRNKNGISFGTFIVNVNGKDVQYSSNSEAVGNKISGFLRGVRVMGKDPIVKDNIIEDFNVGVQVDTDNIVCENNTMTTNRHVAAYGFFVEDVNNGVFRNNTMTLPRRPVYFKNLNSQNDSQIIIENNNFTSRAAYDLLFENVKNTILRSNKFNNTKVEQRSTANFTVDSSNEFN